MQIANDLTKTLNRALQDKEGDKYGERSIGIDYFFSDCIKHSHVNGFNCIFVLFISFCNSQGSQSSPTILRILKT